MNIMDVCDLGKATTGINGHIYFALSGEIKRVYFQEIELASSRRSGMIRLIFQRIFLIYIYTYKEFNTLSN
jgi:hypothetical protein